jgi:hypothetical protein
LPQGLCKRSRLDPHPAITRLGQPRKLRRRQRPKGGREPAGLDLGVVIGELDRHRVALELAHQLCEQPGRHDSTALAVDLGRNPDTDGQFEVGAHELQRSAV